MLKKVRTIALSLALMMGALTALPTGAAADSYLGLGGGTGPKLDFRIGPENKRFERRELRQFQRRNRERYERNRHQRPRFERDRRRQPDFRQQRRLRRQ